MSSSTLSQQLPASTSSAEPADTQRRIKLTIKPLKLKFTASTSSVDSPNHDAATNAQGPSHVKPPSITIKPLKLKPSRSSSRAETPSVTTQDDERRHLPKLIIKPLKPSHAAVTDANAMKVDDAPSVAPSLPIEEPPKDEAPIEILPVTPPPAPTPARPHRPAPPPKVKVPRPIKLKPLKEVLRRLIFHIKKKDDYAFFLDPVDTSQVSGYLDLIKHPMDFGTMTEKVERGQYRSLEQFKDDFCLVTSNAKTFNPPPSLYHSEASKIEAWGLDQISKAAVQVIEYETDWNIDVVADEGPEPTITAGNVMDQSGGEPAAIPGDMPVKTRSPSVMSSVVGTPIILAERSKRNLRGKKVPVVTQSWEEGGHLPGFKDGIGVFPPCSDLAALMLELKLRGKRFTKKERIKREKEGPPFAPDGSLEFTEMQNPYTTAFHQLVPEPITAPQMIPLIPTSSSPAEVTTSTQGVSQPAEEKRDVLVDGPVAIPPEKLSDVLADPNRHVFVNMPSSTSLVGTKHLHHWTITRNPPRATRARDDEEDGVLIGPQAKRRRVEHTDYGAFATLLGTIAAENGLKADDFEETFGNDEKILQQIRQSIESHEPVTKPLSTEEPEDETRERLLDADEYIRDVVYGGVDGLAYFRSIAEFVGEYQGPLKEDSGVTVPPGELGMPLARWAALHVIKPLTLGNHTTLREVAETLTRANVQEQNEAQAHASRAIERYLALANEDKSSVMEQLRELEALAEPTGQIDIAPLLRKPEELFLAENEWAGRGRSASASLVGGTNPIRAAVITGAGAGTDAMFGLGLASVLPGQSRLSGALVGDTPGAIEHALSAGAEALRDLGRRISEEAQELKTADGNVEGGTEDTLMRQTRLTLIALAKRAPIDRIARLPPELVPVHIRHIVPTLGS